MGYTTSFTGRFTLDRPLDPEHAAYLHLFANTRRMRRNVVVAESLPDPVRVAARVPIGPGAAYFTGGVGFAGQGHDPSVIDSNRPPEGQPGLWCKWVPTDDLRGIEWSGAEKFYDYTEWLQYLIDHFLTPLGYVLSGSVRWCGEGSGDTGTLAVVDGKAVATEDVNLGSPAAFADAVLAAIDANPENRRAAVMDVIRQITEQGHYGDGR
jgi:hypothetical protein